MYDREYLEHYRRLADTELGKRIVTLRWGLLRRYLNGHKSLLDYGTGSGAFLSCPDRIPGLELSGYEINPESEYCHAETPRLPDVMTAFDVIEHLPNPKDWILTYRPKLLVVLTPNAGAVPRDRIFDWKHYKPGEHIHYFSIDSLKALFEETGYRVEGWDFIEAAHRNPNAPMDLVTMIGSRR